MTKAQLLAVGSTAELCEVVELGKYWGFRCGHWCKVKVLSLPCSRGGTGEIAYAPIDKRGYPYAGGIALQDCQAFWGPVKAWGDKPPKVSRRALLEKGVSEFWLRPKKRPHNASHEGPGAASSCTVPLDAREGRVVHRLGGGDE